MKIFAINPGSTSTKIALFEDERLLHEETITHRVEDLERFATLWEQLPWRREAIAQALERWGERGERIAVVVGRGGLLKPVEGGVYRVTERMLEDARRGVQGEHPSNLGCVLAWEFAERWGALAVVVDPVSVDEFEPLARYSGHPLIERRSLSHALSAHAAARAMAARLGKPLSQTSFVIAHLGGGISVAAVRGGRIVDANDASSDGPFSPERTGSLPLQPFITLCFSGKFTESEMRRLVMGRGGLVAYLGTNEATEVERRIAEGDAYAREVYEAMAYQIAKEIGAMATVLRGRVDAILLIGSLARSTLLTDWIRERVAFIAEVVILPEEWEMKTMAEMARRALMGEEPVKEYV
ncbi:MAG: butyrate kinase [Blastocatellia bacterium]|nr:butyrate kinase [Blastocatellia bacterium]MCS7156260.1 butyrate kinase [Blastocatellia bacterium]MCX7751390.1 butyrate kinase [Blastocatellia bacterium]MDW8169103.1 butyrate kinase [Acidobacteriota bacterium]MDW8255807.1 butyrate kinase [Acidobacteriota bacterium]